MRERLYSSPPGKLDLPFLWVFDASSLNSGQSYVNLLTYLQGGYGDFLLRRIVGVSRLLSGTATFQLQDRDLNPIESVPIIGATADQILLPGDRLYKELGAIRFSMGPVTLASPSTTSQIAFQGVRRIASNAPRNPTYKAYAKSYTYFTSIPVNAPVGSMVRSWVPITDYDFELYQVILLSATLGQLGPAPEEPGLLFLQVNPNIAITITTTTGNPTLTVVLTGSTLTINLTGNPAIDTNQAVLNLIEAIPNISALLNVSLQPSNAGPSQYPASEEGTFVLGSSVGPLNSPISTVWLYDQNRVAISNIPVLDLFLDGGPEGVYQNGAIVTPLWYRKDSSVQIDVYSQSSSGGQALVIYLVGKKYYPC